MFRAAKGGAGRIPAVLAVTALPLCLPLPLRAEDPPAFPDFTFKMVRPPTADTKKRITVQISPLDRPATPATPAAPVAMTPVPDGSPGRYPWFWQAISPLKADTGPGRLEPALQALSHAPEGQEVPAPRLAQLMAIAQDYMVPLLLHSAGTQVSPALALAVLAVESAGRTEAESGAGAQGLMQLMPATAARYGVTDPFDADQNIAGGIAFLNDLMTAFKGDPILVLAGYNAGETQLALHEGVPEYAETRDYVPKVLAAFAVARGLCVTQPELISDGCVFRLPE